ncbi:11342_t:CDS:2, partial [Funneliformis geosporum]
DLESLALNFQYDDILKTNEQIRPIWILLVDGRPDKNPRYLKNIMVYCQLFKKFDLDYLSVRTHIPGKLAGITLPIDHFGKHLDLQGNVTNLELASQNF